MMRAAVLEDGPLPIRYHVRCDHCQAELHHTGASTLGGAVALALAAGATLLLPEAITFQNLHREHFEDGNLLCPRCWKSEFAL